MDAPTPETPARGGPAAGGPLRLPTNTKRSLDFTPETPAVAGIEPDDGWQERDHENGCPNAPAFAFVSASTGAVVPARCGRLSCGYCLRIAASRRAAALALARPERAVLLTRAGTDWSTVRPRLNRVRYDIARATGKPFEWAYNVEPNPSGDGQHHVHAWTHGAFVDQRLLSEIADRRGFGSFARINRVRSNQGASKYGLKGIGYGMKGTAADDSQAAYLLANGKRLTHQSRGFFRDAAGQGLPVREAERLAMQSQRTDPGPWTLIAL